MQWKRITLAVLVYFALSSVALFATMAFTQISHANLMLPFAAFTYAAFMLLLGTKSAPTSNASVAIGVFLMVCVSFVTYPVGYLFPKHLATPYYGPAGAIFSLVLIVPAIAFLRYNGIVGLKD